MNNRLTESSQLLSHANNNLYSSPHPQIARVSFLFSEEENLFTEKSSSHAVNRTVLRPNVPHFD